jgi:RNA polymerase sigma factor (sigma-70 family)
MPLETFNPRTGESAGREAEVAWVRAAQSGRDPRAFAELVRSHQGVVRAVLRRLCSGNSALADEMAQEAFIKAWQALPTFRFESRFRTWVIRLAWNVFLAHQRRGEARLSAATDSTSEPSDLPDDVAQAGHGAVPSGSLSQAVAMGLDVERALKALSEPERQAIVQCYWGDLSHAEAAEVLGWPLGTVKTHVLRGRAKLQTLLAAWAPPGRASPSEPQP